MVLRPVTAAAWLIGRNITLVRRWANTGRITSACDTRTRELLVDLAELTHLDATTQRRRAA